MRYAVLKGVERCLLFLDSVVLLIARLYDLLPVVYLKISNLIGLESILKIDAFSSNPSLVQQIIKRL